MSEKDNIRKELEELAPQLSKLKKEHPFEVPSNYFHRLPADLLEKVKEEEQPGWWQQLDAQIQLWLNTWLKPRYVTPAFATIIILVVVGNLLNIQQDTTGVNGIADNATDNIPEEVLEDYVYEYSEDYDLAMIDDYSLTQYTDEDGNFDLNEDISKEEMEEYLMNNIDDLNLSDALL